MQPTHSIVYLDTRPKHVSESTVHAIALPTDICCLVCAQKLKNQIQHILLPIPAFNLSVHHHILNHDSKDIEFVLSQQADHLCLELRAHPLHHREIDLKNYAEYFNTLLKQSIEKPEQVCLHCVAAQLNPIDGQSTETQT